MWERESWLEILGRYVITVRDKKTQIEKLIFPRYHQLDVTRRLQAAVLVAGAGGKYLVQHSAGSGKTNSIAWTAHFFAELHDAHNQKVFDSVLQNYTPYKLAFRLAHECKDYDEATVERSAAVKSIMGWVRLHPYNIAQKVQVVVEHFRAFVAPLLDGKAKAMVVVGSRIEAVRWKLAIEKYLRAHGYRIGTMVAFSGEVNDKEAGPEPFSETCQDLNPGLKGREIRKAFEGTDYQILLVANKFQTGFDQPLLCGMYVDRRLAGIQAVQTLSRLNRAYDGKTDTKVWDPVVVPVGGQMV